jgi:photosystem II stability/assembly factor-like uncharacterized protein
MQVTCVGIEMMREFMRSKGDDIRREHTVTKWLYLTALCVTLCSRSANAGWVQTGGPYGDSITALVINGGIAFAGTTSDGVYRSTNHGQSWAPVNTGLPKSAWVKSLCVSDGDVFALTNQGKLFVSADNGTSWTECQGAPYPICMAVNGGDIYAGTRSCGVCLYRDGSWTQVDTGLPNTAAVLSLAVRDGAIYAVSASNTYTCSVGGADGILCNSFGVFRSTDNGAHWIKRTNDSTNTPLVVSASVDSDFFAVNALTGRVVRSSDSGQTWIAVDSGLGKVWVNSITTSGGVLYAATRGGVFVSTTNGTIWIQANTGLDSHIQFTTIAANDRVIIAAAYHKGIYISNNGGATWSAANVGIANAYVTSMAASGNNLFAAAGYNGLFRSRDDGASWTEIDSGFVNHYVQPQGYVFSLAADGDNVLSVEQYDGVFRSTNSGASWTNIGSGIPSSGGVTPKVNAIAVVGGNIYAGTDHFNYTFPGGFEYGGVFLSTDTGKSWSAVNRGISTGPETNFYVAGAFAANGSKIFVGLSGGGGAASGRVFLSDNNGTSWTLVDSGLPRTFLDTPDVSFPTFTTEYSPMVEVLTLNDGVLFAGLSCRGVFRSTNDGTTWSEANNGIPSRACIRSFAVHGNYIFAGADTGIYMSADDGESWAQVSSGLPDTRYCFLAVKDDYLFAGTYGNGVWRRPLSEMEAAVAIHYNSQREDSRQSWLRIHAPGRMNGNGIIEFSLAHPGHANIAVYNLSGRQVASLANRYFESGAHSVLWNMNNAPLGYYMVRMQAEGRTLTKNITILR